MTNWVTITEFLHATLGSTGLDFSPSAQYALTPEMGTQTIPTGVYGPLPEGTIGLILGKNSLTLKGLQIHPGVIDQDYTGELTILAQAPQTFVAIAPTGKIAHLIIFPSVRVEKMLMDTPQREKGLGHSDHAYWVQRVTSDCPKMAIFLNGKWFMGLLDTGADVSVVAE
jgi:dUTPase